MSSASHNHVSHSDANLSKTDSFADHKPQGTLEDQSFNAMQDPEFIDEGSSHENINDDILEEKLHYEAVIGALAYYGRASELQFNRLSRQLSLIPAPHQQLIASMSQNKTGCLSQYERIERMRAASKCNAAFINEVLLASTEFFEYVSSATPEEVLRRPNQYRDPPKNPFSGFNAEKVQSTLCQLAREWSADSSPERLEAFQPLIDGLCKYLPVTEETSYKYKVLSPGSGLGRLPLEFCLRGYASVGNEFSFFMLIFSNFMLNKTKKLEQFTIYPWIHQVNNVRSAEEQLAPVKIPDILPSTLPLNANFGYAVGDFLEIIAQEPDEWDAIATSFFLDTARNVIEYIQAIWYTLKPGGYWLNIGPLLYHYADSMESSLELTLDQVLHVVRATGFEILEQRSVACHYTAKRSCMMNTLYNAEFWIAKKPVKGP